MALIIPQNPLETEAVTITVSFAEAIAQVPASAVVWLDHRGRVRELPATLQPGATTSRAVVQWNPSGHITEAGNGLYKLSVRLRDGSGAHIARSLPVSIDVPPYIAAP